MSETYPAILRENRIEWMGDPPPHLPPEQPVRVEVTLLGPASAAPAEQGRLMAEALEQLAARGGRGLPADPVEWQREVRRDRPLPGRDD
jgi:hypothetical protein